MKKRVLSFVLVFMLILSTVAYAVNISIDGTNVSFTEQSGAPFVDGNNRTQVPLRVTMESFGATVRWDNDTRTALVEKDGIKVEVPIGQSHIVRNGKQIKNDTAAIIKDNKTYLPIRAVLEAFGATIGWDSATQTVTVAKSKSEVLKVHFIDVGQADCILIELPNGEEVLIDAGNKGDSNTIINYINNLGIDDIEYFILTHFHEDHIGSAPNILDEFDILKIYIPDTTTDTQIYKETIQAIERENAEVIKAKGGTNIIDTDLLDFDILAPNSMWYSEMNEFSIVTKLVYGDTSFLFTGDAESVSELEMVRVGFDLDVDLLKVGHHGGETSTSQIFLDAVAPKYAVISVGEGNTYGHPHDKALSRLTAAGAKIYRTDEQGTIIATTDSSTITIDKAATTYVPVKEEPIKTDPVNTTGSYIGNSNSLKFHYPTCSSVSTMTDSNKVYFDSREEAINKGYEPCGRCNP
ncbi:stalk domain-containing protein [Sedimentibacter sp.]|uniref:stalk domain-containing protein n=1 Tax=Sedimentibacter sp. TaxID=1960295 RepID=UPI0028B1F976|nr:stalk domain-containing protein [Sedimentibacter sp.]